MLKAINIKNIKSSGFSVIELMGALVVFAFIIISTHRIMDRMGQAKEYNQLADQSNMFAELAIKYIQDNYRTLVQSTSAGNDTILSAGSIKEYKPAIFSTFNKFHQAPCIYITKGTNKSLSAYLIFGSSSARGKSLIQLEIGTIAKAIGNNAGALINNGDTYNFNGSIDKNIKIPFATMTNIGTTCGFNTPLANNLLMVDLSKNSTLFASIRGNIDQQFSSDTPDPSLKKQEAGLATMQTNIYLDNVYKESSTITKYYCDASKLPLPDAADLCQNYAAFGGIFMNTGTAHWSGSTQSGNQCVATAQASFYKIDTDYDCDGVNMGNASDYCPATIGGKSIDPGSAYWSPTPPTLDGNTCVAHAYAYYKLPGTCDGPQWWINTANPSSRGDNDSPPNWQRAVSIEGKVGYNLALFISCAVKQPDDHDTMVHCPGTYNQATGNCDIGLRCIMPYLCKSGVVNTSFPTTGGGGRDPNPTDCGTKVVPAIPRQTPIQLGTLSCGSRNYPLIPSTIGVPAQHAYQAIDYESNNVHVHIKTNAPAGATNESSTLIVNGAGMQAGLIASISHVVTVGSICNSVELGKIIQGISSSTIYSQLQCTYNPTFCTGLGYCYLPLKNTTITYQFLNAKANYMCPIGTIVDSNQPTDGINTAVACPVVAGWTLTQSVHGENTACYTGITKMSFCQGYQSVCTYVQGEKLVTALVKLKCTSETSAYVIDNYTQ